MRLIIYMEPAYKVRTFRKHRARGRRIIGLTEEATEEDEVVWVEQNLASCGLYESVSQELIVGHPLVLPRMGD